MVINTSYIWSTSIFIVIGILSHDINIVKNISTWFEVDRHTCSDNHHVLQISWVISISLDMNTSILMVINILLYLMNIRKTDRHDSNQIDMTTSDHHCFFYVSLVINIFSNRITIKLLPRQCKFHVDLIVFGSLFCEGMRNGNKKWVKDLELIVTFIIPNIYVVD